MRIICDTEKFTEVCLNVQRCIPNRSVMPHLEGILIKTTDEVGEYRLRKRFHEIQKLLPPDTFVRCHRSYIVHLRYIRRYTAQNVLLSNGDLIPVGRTFRAEFHRRFQTYCEEQNPK